MSVTADPRTEGDPSASGQHAQAEPGTKGALTRASILDAAIARFGRDGFRSTSVADIARDAGVSGTATYAYFPNKEALFLAAVDADAAGVIGEGLSSVLGDDERSTIVDWRQSLTFTLLEAVEQHPLAKRLLGGLEPEVTARVLQIPALADLRVACAERLRADQLTGRVRADIDPVSTANGVVAIILSLLMSLVQLGPGITAEYADDVTAVFGAALDPPR